MSTMQSPAICTRYLHVLYVQYIQVSTMLCSGPVIIITAECLTFTLVEVKTLQLRKEVCLLKAQKEIVTVIKLVTMLLQLILLYM